MVAAFIFQKSAVILSAAKNDNLERARGGGIRLCDVRIAQVNGFEIFPRGNRATTFHQPREFFCGWKLHFNLRKIFKSLRGKHWQSRGADFFLQRTPLQQHRAFAVTRSAGICATSVGLRPTGTPFASSASAFAWAVPEEPEMIAPA